MSGGHFDYFHYRLGTFADDLKELLTDEEYCLSPEIIAEVKKAINKSNELAVYARRIDWLVSGDDGEETFFERLKEDLDNAKRMETDNA